MPRARSVLRNSRKTDRDHTAGAAAFALLIAGCLLVVAAAQAARAGDDEVRLLFTGDILLSRQVRREIDQTGRFPWDGFTRLFRSATWVAGNLEGAVGDARDCLPAAPASPCFDIAPTLVPLLAKAGFRALGIANNHAFDLGPAGHEATREALGRQGLDALSWEDSPHFAQLGPYDVAVIAVSTVPGRDGARAEIPSTQLRQKLRLARSLADVVVVFVHWGSELLDWPDVQQRRAAGWLVRNGADVVIGHHPHVVQAPECVLGRPVFFSLGNHLFDQKYPATKRGLIADCRVRGGVLQCGGISTETPAGSAFPQPGDAQTLASCEVNLTPPVAVNGFSVRARTVGGEYLMEGTKPGARAWRSSALPLVSAEAGKLAGPAGPDYLFTLERHPSSLDGEDGVRPYVYEAHEGGLVARWRGSALAWPLLDAALLPAGGGVLCALHRRDSFLVLQPGSTGVRTAAYRWNGFGFSGVDHPETLARCRAVFELDQ
jgi:poly-gamma-glutamate synthesis protein (capsule biosynthesis protein)